MFNLFKKDPVKNLKKKYEKLMQEGMELQRKGDIQGYALKSEEAEKVMAEIQELEKKK